MAIWRKVALTLRLFQSGAKINISDGSCPERIVTVTGNTESIFKAFTLICNKFEEVCFAAFIEIIIFNQFDIVGMAANLTWWYENSCLVGPFFTVDHKRVRKELFDSGVLVGVGFISEREAKSTLIKRKQPPSPFSLLKWRSKSTLIKWKHCPRYRIIEIPALMTSSAEKKKSLGVFLKTQIKVGI